MLLFNDGYLISGESFTLNPNAKTENKKQNEASDEALNEKYKKGEMRIVTEQGRIDLASVVTMLESKQSNKEKYILNPEYQRRKRWNNRRKSLLIESFIMNVPIPPIFLYEIEYARYEVMDGLQRLTAIYDFYKNRFQLEGLEYWEQLNGKKYSDLPENIKGGIDRRYLSSVILLAETAKTKAEATFLKQIVFGRLNSGGEKATAQELRNALYNGEFNKICIQLAKNDLFRKTWHFPLETEVDKLVLMSEVDLSKTQYSQITMDSYQRMDDVELVLRFFAYRHHKEFKTVTVEHFLDAYLKQANQFPNSTIQELAQLFTDTISLVYEIFEEKAFFLPKLKTVHYYSPSKTIYDSMMQAFAQNIQHKEQLIKNKEAIKKNLYKDKALLQHDKSREGKNLFDGISQSRGIVADRIQYFNHFLKDYIH